MFTGALILLPVWLLSRAPAVPAEGQEPAEAQPAPARERPFAAQPSAAPPGGEAPAKFLTHSVAPGDTLGTVAMRHGLKLETLLHANGLSEQDLLQIGQELRVPTVDGLLHRSADGDTLWDIANAHGASTDAVIRANPDVEPGSLPIGGWLLVPGGRPVERRIFLAARGGEADRRQPAPARPAPAPAPAPAKPAEPAPAPPAGPGKFSAWPLRGPITDPFGWRIHPIYGTRSFHDGIDISGDTSAPIVAVAAGRVVLAEWYGGWGLTVKVDHGNGLVTRYSLASKLLVKIGDQVQPGQVIARVGSTGVSTGPHLDFGVYRDGKALDPEQWLP